MNETAAERLERVIANAERELRRIEARVAHKVATGEATQEQADSPKHTLSRRRLQGRIDFLNQELDALNAKDKQHDARS